MEPKRYVQHISGVGEKWEIVESHTADDGEIQWCVRNVGTPTYWFPKSEYRLVDPPTRWVDVTDTATVEGLHVLFIEPHDYRLRKVQNFWTDEHHGPRWAFIVEKKETP